MIPLTYSIKLTVAPDIWRFKPIRNRCEALFLEQKKKIIAEARPVKKEKQIRR